MATYNINILDGNPYPTSAPITVVDSTPGDSNYITFNNTTPNGVLITGDQNWSIFFSENNINLPTSSGANSVTLLINPTSSQSSETIQYSLGYTDYVPSGEPVPDADPVFIITVNP